MAVQHWPPPLTTLQRVQRCMYACEDDACGGLMKGYIDALTAAQRRLPSFAMLQRVHCRVNAWRMGAQGDSGIRSFRSPAGQSLRQQSAFQQCCWVQKCVYLDAVLLRGGLQRPLLPYAGCRDALHPSCPGASRGGGRSCQQNGNCQQQRQGRGHSSARHSDAPVGSQATNCSNDKRRPGFAATAGSWRTLAGRCF